METTVAVALLLVIAAFIAAYVIAAVISTRGP